MGGDREWGSVGFPFLVLWIFLIFKISPLTSFFVLLIGHFVFHIAPDNDRVLLYGNKVDNA